MNPAVVVDVAVVVVSAVVESRCTATELLLFDVGLRGGAGFRGGVHAGCGVHVGLLVRTGLVVDDGLLVAAPQLFLAGGGVGGGGPRVAGHLEFAFVVVVLAAVGAVGLLRRGSVEGLPQDGAGLVRFVLAPAAAFAAAVEEEDVALTVRSHKRTFLSAKRVLVVGLEHGFAGCSGSDHERLDGGTWVESVGS